MEMTNGSSNMSSIDEMELEIRKLFDSLLRAYEVGKQGMPYFPISVDKNLQSYYELPQHSEYVNFAWIDTKDKESLVMSLTDLWKNLNSQEFLPLVSAMSEIAFKLKETQGEQSSELSPFVYTLY